MNLIFRDRKSTYISMDDKQMTQNMARVNIMPYKLYIPCHLDNLDII